MIMLEALLIMEFLQTKPQIKTKILNYYLYYTLIENLSDEGGES